MSSEEEEDFNIRLTNLLNWCSWLKRRKKWKRRVNERI